MAACNVRKTAIRGNLFDNVIDGHIARIRRKIDDSLQGNSFMSVRTARFVLMASRRIVGNTAYIHPDTSDALVYRYL